MFQPRFCNVTRECLGLLMALAIIPLADSVLNAQSTSPQQAGTSRASQSSAPMTPRPFKDEAADAARDATLWLLSLPVVPAICFSAAVVIAIVWVWVALRHRIRILTGTVTISGVSASHVQIQLRAPSGYACMLSSSGGIFTVYDVPDEPLDFELTLSDPAVPPPGGAPPKLIYNIPRQNSKTWSWNVNLPLEPNDLRVNFLNATDRSISWRDPMPNPSPTTPAVLPYTFAAEVRASGAVAFVTLPFTPAVGMYMASAQKDSIVRLTTKIDGLSNEFSKYLSIP
jgi:hypothetical protein